MTAEIVTPEELDRRVTETFMSSLDEIMKFPEMRVVLGNALIRSVTAQLPRVEHPAEREQGTQIKRRGFVELGPILSPSQIADLHAYFAGKDLYNNEMYHQSDRIGRRIGQGAEGFRLGGYHIDDVVRAPHLLEAANHPSVIGAVEEFLGCVPTITLMSSWWSFPDVAHGDMFGQHFHRDWDDFKFCALFFYLSDVDAESGPHQYIVSGTSAARPLGLALSAVL